MDIPLMLASIIFLISLLCIHYHYKIKTPSKTQNPPGPPRLPLIGNLHQLSFTGLHKHFWKLSQNYGPLMSLKLGLVPTLVVSSVRLAEEVLKNQDSVFCSRPKLLGQQRLSYNGLDIALAPYSYEWRERRKICVVHLLSAKRVHQFRPIRENEASRMIRRIKNDAESGRVTNLSETLVSVTSTMICRIAFGKRLDDGSHERRRFYQLLHETQTMFVGFFFSDYFPSLGWIDHLTGMRSRLESLFQEFDSFYQELIDEHLDQNRPNSMDDDIIDLMLQLQRDESVSSGITVEHIKAMLMNVFVAGTDDTSITLIWAMTALMKNPKVMKKVQKEIREVMGEKEILDEDDIKMLPYFKLVVMETFRLYPIEPLLLPRITLKKCYVDGYEIPAKTLVYVNAWGIARDPEVWENPDAFCPERFLNSTIDVTGQDFQFLPFGSGRRGCPGRSMGLAMVHLLLANLLNSFDWGLPDGMNIEDIDTECLPGLALFKKEPLKLVAKISASAPY